MKTQILFTACITLFLAGHISAQPFNSEAPDRDSLIGYIQMKYGLDQELINGLQYYKQYVQYMGDPFFPKDLFYKGSVTLKGIPYEGVHLKYDSYSQYLILEYTDFRKIYNQLIINSIHVDSFRLGPHLFQKLSLSGESPLFYQVFSSGPVTCYVHWRKEISSISYNFKYTHEFSVPIGTYYIRYRGLLQPFTNRKSFVSIFPDSMKSDLMKYFRQHQLSFRTADPAELQKLVNFAGINQEILSGF